MGLMKEIFDFNSIKEYLRRPKVKFVYDGMAGASGPYAVSLFANELGVNKECMINCTPLEDFGGHHPDPNLVHGRALAEKLCVFDSSRIDETTPELGAAGDGDGDRNMIVGKGIFVTPSDSVAIIASYAQKCIPYFKDGLKGLGRSMPTSMALDRVAQKIGCPLYEVPTGWKFFTNLMDKDMLSICGEESFGTGSNHIREKDGLWAVLAWLSILAYSNKSSSKLVTVKDIVEGFWLEYGRNFYQRFDYEEVDSSAAEAMMKHLRSIVEKRDEWKNISLSSSVVDRADEFSYKDPVDESLSVHQGIRFFFVNGSRIIWRTSGTGSVGATIRIYMEIQKTSLQDGDTTAEVLKEISQLAISLCQMEKLTGRTKPTVIT